MVDRGPDLEDPSEMVDDKGVELVVHKVTKMADELFLYERQFLIIIKPPPPPKKKWFSVKTILYRPRI